MLTALWLLTDKGGISSNYGRLASNKERRGYERTFRVKSPYSPHKLGVADDVAKVDVGPPLGVKVCRIDEVFEYKGAEVR